MDARREEETRVLLVEDHGSFRQALAFVLSREPELWVAAEAGSIEEARGLASGADREGFQLAVVDLGLPDGDGVEFVRELASGKPSIATLVLSASVDEAQLARSVEAGASGVLHKSARLEEIVDAVCRLNAGEALLTPNQTIEMLRIASRDRRDQHETRKAIESLTRRERDVLQALAEGLDSKEIAAKLYITVETERTHVVNILGKLGVHSRLQALVFAARHDLVDLDGG